MRIPHINPFALAEEMANRAERKLPPRADWRLCRVPDCLQPALPDRELCHDHHREVLAELEAWGYARRLRDETGAATVRDVVELVALVAGAQFAGLAIGLLMVV